jgi:hypothetical protein
VEVNVTVAVMEFSCIIFKSWNEDIALIPQPLLPQEKGSKILLFSSSPLLRERG